MENWNTYRENLIKQIGEYAEQSPNIMHGVNILNKASAQSGLLEPKIHSLIALAVAVTTRCGGCISVHTQKAVENGATKEEIAEALGTAIALNAGAALAYSVRVLDNYNQLPTE